MFQNEKQVEKVVLADLRKIQVEKPLVVKERDYFPETLLYGDEYRQVS